MLCRFTADRCDARWRHAIVIVVGQRREHFLEHLVLKPNAMSRTATTQEEVRDELETYLRDKGISNLFIHIVETMLLHKPDNPIQFIMDHLRDNYPADLGRSNCKIYAAVAERVDTDLLLESDDEDESDDDLITSVRAIPIARRTRRRPAISAGACCQTLFSNLYTLQFSKRRMIKRTDSARFYERTCYFMTYCGRHRGEPQESSRRQEEFYIRRSKWLCTVS